MKKIVLLFLAGLLAGSAYPQGYLSLAYSLTATPGWVSSAPTTALDFDLLSTSSAIGAGTSLPVFDDYEEAPRPQSTTWDQGAFEFISSTPVVTIATQVATVTSLGGNAWKATTSVGGATPQSPGAPP